ncbi:MAG: AAA family ATPase [Ruminococcus sp.]|nr:AAA family ATPase [Ruminococcus sp.]
MKNFKIGDIVLNKYRVDSEPICTGGTADVYKVHNLSWDMDMAMKVSHEAVSMYADDECECWIGLGTHPNIVTCYHYQLLEDNSAAAFLEWADGGSLYDNIISKELYKDDEELVKTRILDIAIQVLYGLKFAHERPEPVLHSDLKPGNIMLMSDGTVKITDFGMDVVQNGFTPQYAHIDVQNLYDDIDSKADKRYADFFSFGATLLAILCGGAKWDNVLQLKKDFDKYFDSRIVDFDNDIAELIKKCLAVSSMASINLQDILDNLLTLYKKYSGAEYTRLYFKGMEQIDDRADYLNNRALSFYDAGRIDEAKKYWTAALELVPNHIETYYNIYLLLPDDKDFVSELDEKINGVNVFLRMSFAKAQIEEIRENGEEPKPHFSKTAFYPEFAKYQKKYDIQAKLIGMTLNSKDYSGAVYQLKLLSKIPFFGKSELYYKYKKKVAEHFEKHTPVIFDVKYFKGDIYHAAVSSGENSMILLHGYNYAEEFFNIYEPSTMIMKGSVPLEKTPFTDINIRSINLTHHNRIVYTFYKTDDNEDLCTEYPLYASEYDWVKEEFTVKECPNKYYRCKNSFVGESEVPNEIKEKLSVYDFFHLSADGFTLIAWRDDAYAVCRLDYTLDTKKPIEPEPITGMQKRTYDVTERKCDTDGIIGVNSQNAFLFNMLTREQLDLLRKVSKITLGNPSVEFQSLAKEAKEHIDTYGDDIPQHKNPLVMKMITSTDEEYDDMLNECRRQSEYWNNMPEKSFLSLFINSANIREKNNGEQPAVNFDFPEFEHKPAVEQRRGDMIEKSRIIRQMREKLLNTVLGQEHAVHIVTEGLFNAEIISANDKSRKRPRAIFTFAGPPGVGKTFLAEQISEMLDIPYKRFDMSEYSGHNAVEGLIGFDFTWKNASPGKLTNFVRENPHSILLFDEFEKADITTIQIFYQMLDAGIVTDKYIESIRVAAETGAVDLEAKPDLKKLLETDPQVSFKDTIIIFTTNVGRSLYEESEQCNSSYSVKTILNALETEINPITKSPYFPSAIVSRMSTGYPLLFNRLEAHHLVGVIEKNFEDFRSLILEQYGIAINADSDVLLSLLFSYGGITDARSASARTALFFKNELYKLVNYNYEFAEQLREINFTADINVLPDKLKKLYRNTEKRNLLIYGDGNFAKKCTKKLSAFNVFFSDTVDDAARIAQEMDINLVLIDIAHMSADREAVVSDKKTSEKTIIASMSARNWRDGKRLFHSVIENIPEMPVYILETHENSIDSELLLSFVRLGARGKITCFGKNAARLLAEQLNEISIDIYMQSVAADMAAQHKALTFETLPKYNGSNISVSLCNFALERVTDADDIDTMVSDIEKPKERFDDVIGAEAAKKELKFFVNYLKNPKKYAAQGHRLPKGVLLYGKPGTGKTMLAKALAGESDVTFIPSSASSFAGRYVGSGPEAVRTLFKKARRYAPSIIFIDEVDAVAKQRTGSNPGIEDTLNALLVEMDGFSVDPKHPVFVLAATNYETEKGKGGIGVLDEAFVRRFDRKVRIELPNKDERKQLLEALISKISQHNISEEAIENIASRTIGTSPAILTNIIEAAKRMAFDKGILLNGDILEEAYEQNKFGNKKDWGEEYLMRTARHEAGHAIINYLCGNTPEYVTIEARSDHGGYMEYSEEQRNAPLHTQKQLIEKIRVALGGRAAELIYYGEDDGISTGPSGDLESATSIARAMLTEYGMDRKFGLAAMSFTKQSDISDLRNKINEILNEEMENSIRMLTENKYLADALVDELMKKNRLTGTQIEELLNNVQKG